MGGAVIGRSDSKVIKNSTPYKHAELIAIQDALLKKPNKNNLYGELKGCTMYVSCEPCPMCMGAILYQEFKGLFYAAKLEDSDKYYCPEILASCKDVAKCAKNRNIKIHCIMREEAVKVLQSRT